MPFLGYAKHCSIGGRDEIGLSSWFQVSSLNRYVKPFCYDFLGPTATVKV